MTETVTFRRCLPEEAALLGALVAKLWPHHSAVALAEEFAPVLLSEETAVFLAFDGARAVGFAQCQLRHDYVEGTSTSPVGYLEGIFVEEGYRGRGVAKALLGRCEGWAKELGCREFASDCELTNLESLRFHLALGFTEENRIICFAKTL